MAGERILLVADSQVSRTLIPLMVSAGYQAAGKDLTREGVLREISYTKPDIVLLDFELMGPAVFMAARDILDSRDTLAALLIPAARRDEILEILKEQFIPFLEKPFTSETLFSVLEALGIAHRYTKKLESELASLRREIDTRKLIEKAKGILMETLNISEDDAYRRMRTQSMNHRASMRSLAEAVILSQGLKD